MKNLKSIFTVLIMYCLLSSGCKQITKSIDETIHPKVAPVKPRSENQVTKSSSDTTVIQQVEQSTTIISTHSETHTTIDGKQVITGTQKHTPTFWTTEKLQKAEAALRALPQYAGKEIFIYQSALFYEDGRIILMLRHPQNPRYVDNYQYKAGKWSEPKPEQLSVHTNIANLSVSLNKASFAGAAKVIQLYNEKAAQVEGAQPATFVYIAVWDKSMHWFPTTISGSRERYAIQFNNDGTLKSFVQD